MSGSAFWAIVLRSLGQYFLRISHPAFPPGAIAQELGHFPPAMREDRTPLPSTFIS
ncbi:hypothetical protein MPNT_40012 [Candidatus Methylacidithermus pantelleriae]|uniref:Uncharacterized protein n=1 Tax=Candidatus Methylacidithermus pantelleriae TaxID=2744239 RepID=A0A8J2BR23_9BACT|nr:hypothetical protein MPNT_40012 [Candidatus Methylacidithermus pantelleriae]